MYFSTGTPLPEAKLRPLSPPSLFKRVLARGHPWNMFKYGDTLDFYEKCNKPNIPRKSDFNFMKFEFARVVYRMKKYHLRCLKLILNAGFPGNPNFEIPMEFDLTIFFIGFRIVDLVGNRFLIIKILKHKKMPNNLNSGIEPNNLYC